MTEEIPIMRWDDWPQHPTWKTERQHGQEGLIPGGDPVARVWYGNKYMKRRGEPGHYILLFDTTLATPKVITPEKQAAMEKAAATALANRTCPVCGKERSYKIQTSDKYGVKLCTACHDDQDEITRAREWLAGDCVILDTETSGLDYGARVLSISVIDMHGNILLNTYIKHDEPINEALTEMGEDWYGNEVEKPTAFSINGIGNETVKDAPGFPAMWAALLPIIEGKTVLCYNVEFDANRLNENRNHYNLPDWKHVNWRCVMEWYAMYHGEYDERHGSYRWVRLTRAVQDQGATVENAHDAHGDCQLTLALIKAIAAKKAPLDELTANK